MRMIGVPLAWRWVLGLAFVAGCAAEEEPGRPPTCTGEEPARLDIGQGGETWVPWFDGDEIPLELSGRYGFWITLRTRGMDTRDLVDTSLAFTIGDARDVTEVEAPIAYTCQPDGTGTGTFFATLPDPLQSDEAAQALEGEALDLVATTTDRSGEVATAEIGLVLQSRWLSTSH